MLGRWHVQPDLNLISEGSTQHQLEPLAMEVLVLLAASPGELVRTDDIIRTVWADTPMADNPVYKTVAKLRQALGDDSRNPTYIETISKRGYRLIGQVSELPEAVDSELVARQPKPLVLATWIVAGIAVLAALFYWQRQAEPLSASGASPVNVGALPGNSFSPRYAPDSADLLFVNDNGGTQQIWIHKANGQVQQLTSGTTDSHSPVWHPDGRSFLFESKTDVYQQQLESTAEPLVLITNASNPDWSPDGKRLLFERNAAVWLADGSGSKQVRVDGIADRDMLFRPRQPRFSPDGRRVLYFEAAEGPLGDFWEIDLGSGSKKRLTNDTTLAGQALYTRDGKHIIFNSQRGGSMTLWSLALDGGEPSALLQSAGNDANPSNSADGRFVAFDTKRDRWGLVVSNLETGKTTTYLESGLPILAPVVSPNREHIAYFAVGIDGAVDVYTLRLSDKQITAYSSGSGTVNSMPAWSGDSRYIYFYSLDPATGSNSYQKMPLGGGASTKVAHGWQFNREHDVSPSADGSVIAMALVDGLQVVDTLLVNAASGNEKSLKRRLSWFDWSKDNQRFLATDFANSPLPIGAIVLCTRNGDCDELSSQGQHPVWSADEKSVYFANPTSRTEMEIHRIALGDGSQTTLGQVTPIDTVLGPFFDILGPNEIVWVRWQETHSELWQVELEGN